MTTRNIPTEQEVQGYMQSLSNWGRWGDDDEIGTLNLITEAKKAEAGALVKEGVAVSCSRLIVPEIAPDLGNFRIPPVHYMISSGEAAPAKGSGGASDFLALYYHGVTITHLDAICHQFWDGQMYNGRPADSVGVQKKASEGGVELAKDGVVTRGVLAGHCQAQGRGLAGGRRTGFPRGPWRPRKPPRASK